MVASELIASADWLLLDHSRHPHPPPPAGSSGRISNLHAPDPSLSCWGSDLRVKGESHFPAALRASCSISGLTRGPRLLYSV